MLTSMVRRARLSAQRVSRKNRAAATDDCQMVKAWLPPTDSAWPTSKAPASSSVSQAVRDDRGLVFMGLVFMRSRSARELEPDDATDDQGDSDDLVPREFLAEQERTEQGDADSGE